MVKLGIVVAMSDNDVIGVNGKLPWHLPEDLAHFKLLTIGCPCIMGRKTFEDIGRPLPMRENIVVTSRTDIEGVHCVPSIEEAIKLGRELAKNAQPRPAKRVFVIGGERLFETAFPLAQELFITRVRTTIQGDRYFTPRIDLKWRFISSNGCVTESTVNPGLRMDFQYWEKR